LGTTENKDKECNGRVDSFALFFIWNSSRIGGILMNILKTDGYPVVLKKK